MNWTTWFCFVVVWLFFRTWTSVFIVMFRSCCFGLYSHMCSSWSPIIHSNKPENSLIKFMSAIGFFFSCFLISYAYYQLIWSFIEVIYAFIYLFIYWLILLHWLINLPDHWLIYLWIHWLVYLCFDSCIDLSIDCLIDLFIHSLRWAPNWFIDESDLDLDRYQLLIWHISTCYSVELYCLT